jgi:hypothetical protein
LYKPFLSLLPPGGHILDAGCGSGRDALEFKRWGFAFELALKSLRLDAREAEKGAGG